MWENEARKSSSSVVEKKPEKESAVCMVVSIIIIIITLNIMCNSFVDRRFFCLLLMWCSHNPNLINLENRAEISFFWCGQWWWLCVIKSEPENERTILPPYCVRVCVCVSSYFFFWVGCCCWYDFVNHHKNLKKLKKEKKLFFSIHSFINNMPMWSTKIWRHTTYTHAYIQYRIDSIFDFFHYQIGDDFLSYTAPIQ